MNALSTPFITPLPHRALLAVEGEERAAFLHGLLSCAVNDLPVDRGAWGALLTAQGKFLHEVFLTAGEKEILLEGEAERLDDLFTRLKRYRLRSKVTLEQRPSWTVFALWTTDGSRPSPLPETAGAVSWSEGRIILADPRLPTAGWRLYQSGAGRPPEGVSAADGAAWDRWRCTLGLPDGSRDMAVESATLLENGFAELGGVDFNKGCFVGQEVTARMRYRGLVKKRLLPVTFGGPAPAPGARLRTAAGADAGTLRSVVPANEEQGGSGLALLRLAVLEQGPFIVGDSAAVAALAPRPGWVMLPEGKGD